MMKLLSIIIFLISTNLLFAQDTLNNNLPKYFISQIELRYELIDLEKIKSTPPFLGKYNVFSDLHQSIKPFSPDEFPPFFNLELSAKDIFEFKSGLEIESLKYFWKAENNFREIVTDNHYGKSSWVISTNFDDQESVNFYNFWNNKNVSVLKNQVTILSLFYQKEKFLRSFFEWNLKLAAQHLQLNLSYLHNNFYQHKSNTAIGNGNRRYVFFPKKFHEQRMNDGINFQDVQNQNISSSSVFANLLWSPYQKTYLKIEYDLHWLFLSNNKPLKQRFRTFGIGTKPMDGTIIFLEYTNRDIGFNQLSGFIFLEQKPYFSLSAKRILKLRLFDR